MLCHPGEAEEPEEAKNTEEAKEEGRRQGRQGKFVEELPYNLCWAPPGQRLGLLIWKWSYP